MIWIVALSPMLAVKFAGRGTCGRQNDPGYGSFVGPTTWKAGIMGFDMFGGVLPIPRLM